MTIRRLLAPVAILTLAGCAAPTPPPDAPARTYVAPRTAANADQPPFSGATRVGDTLYLSGHIGIDANQQVPDTAEGEAEAVLDQFKATIEQGGMTMDDLVYVQIFCSDVAHYSAFNTVYRRYFQKEFPARAFIGSGPLLFGARFEVQGIAVKRTEG